MIISVLTLSAALLAATGIGGLLMIYQLRSANDAVNSAKALFAADAGIEAVSFCYFKDCAPSTPEDFVASITFERSDGTPGQQTQICSGTPGAAPEEVYVCLTLNTVTANTITVNTSGFANFGKTVRILEAVFVQSP